MAVSISSKTPELQTPRLLVRLPDLDDADAIVRYYFANAEFFASTDPPLPRGFHTRPFWLRRIEQSHAEFDEDSAVRLFLFRLDRPAAVVGAINFTQVFRGAFHSCVVGYTLDEKHQGQGLMGEALQAAIAFMFGPRNLHRIGANTLPENTRSQRLLERLGFQRDGLARDYLFINGRWRDHVLNSLINPHWRSPE
jgi:[ribosomal protein S5]-alanine N-acetyltransferase